MRGLKREGDRRVADGPQLLDVADQLLFAGFVELAQGADHLDRLAALLLVVAVNHKCYVEGSRNPANEVTSV